MNLIQSNAVTMSSREIAELTGKQHSHVVRDIRAMLDALKDDPLLDHPREDKDRRGYTTSFHLDKILTETLITGYSIPIRKRVIERLHVLESKVRELEQAKRSRQTARLEAPAMTEALKVQRQAEGKEIRPHHFSNEFDLINRIALGCTSKQFRAEHGIGKADAIRDHLTPMQIRCIEHLQRLNTSLIEIGMDFFQRKAKLNQVYVLRHKRALLAEVVALEA